MKAVPEIGEEYHFFDDGKTGPSRHYICRVERIIPKEEAKNIVFSSIDRTLYDIWRYEVRWHDWLYAVDTDFFVEASCPTYDEHNLWFARKKDGGWFSMDIQSGWQSGELDVTGKIFDSIVKVWTEYGYDTSDYISVTYYKK